MTVLEPREIIWQVALGNYLWPMCLWKKMLGGRDRKKERENRGERWEEEKRRKMRKPRQENAGRETRRPLLGGREKGTLMPNYA